MKQAFSIRHPDWIKWVRDQSTPSSTCTSSSSLSSFSESLTNYVFIYFMFSRASLAHSRSYLLAVAFIKITIGMLCMQRKKVQRWPEFLTEKIREANTTEEVKLSSVSRIRPAWCMRESRRSIEKSEFNICENLLRDIYGRNVVRKLPEKNASEDPKAIN